MSKRESSSFMVKVTEELQDDGFWAFRLEIAEGLGFVRVARTPAMAAGFAIKAWGETIIEEERERRRREGGG